MADLIDEESRLLKTNEEEPASLFPGLNQSAMEEEEGPWPSTFERSIKLLAGPQTDVDDINRITRSPRFVPIQASKARVSSILCELKKFCHFDGMISYRNSDALMHAYFNDPKEKIKTSWKRLSYT